MRGIAGPAAAVGIVVTVGTLAACSSSADEGLLEGGPVAYVDDVPESAMEALLEGTLELRETCVVTVRNGHATLPVFAEPLTSWDGTTLRYGGQSFSDGSAISVGGGGVDPSVADYLPAGCDHDGVFLVGSVVPPSGQAGGS